jgi:ATP-dependent DNA ligase
MRGFVRLCALKWLLRTILIRANAVRECRTATRGTEWRYELKLDGFRAIRRKSGRSAQLWSRHQKDFTGRFLEVTRGIAELPAIR